MPGRRILAGQRYHHQGRRDTGNRLTAAGIPHDLKVYPSARHSFFNDQLRTYDPAAAADSWQRVLTFFAKHVRHNLAGSG